MKVSVIIPVKNRAALLRNTLSNVFKQSLKDFEVIVVDDHSNDNPQQHIDEFDSRITFVQSNGSGPGAARNTGLQLATGDAIQFFDSDDLLSENKLAVQADLLFSKNVDFVYGPYVKATELSHGHWRQEDRVMQYKPLPGNNLIDYVLRGWCPITQSVLFKRSFISKVGLWREDLMPHEDFEYWARIAMNQPTYLHENLSCVLYRQHLNQITDQAVKLQDRWLDGINAFRLISEKAMVPTASRISRALFIGQHATAKLQFNKRFKTAAQFSVSPTEKMLSIYQRVHFALERKLTGTAWRVMHGVIKNDQHLFSNYIKTIQY